MNLYSTLHRAPFAPKQGSTLELKAFAERGHY